MITKTQFNEWKNTEVTQALYSEIKEAVEEVASEMLVRRHSDPNDDQYIKGFIRGVQSSLEWVPNFQEEDEENGQN